MHAWPRGTRPLMHQPSFLPEYPIHGLLVHAMGRLTAQHGPKMPIAERGVLLNQLPERFDPRLVYGHRTSTTHCGAMQPGPSDD